MSENHPMPIHPADYEAALLALEGELNDEQFEALNRRAAKDPALAELMFTLAEQRWAVSEAMARSMRLGELDDVQTHASPPPAPIARPGGRIMRWAAMVAIAASIGAVAMMMTTGRDHDAATPDRELAMAGSIVALHGAGSTQRGQTLVEGSDVPAGTLHIESGFVEMITSRGVHLTLRGPGEYELVDGLHASVRSGAMAASVPHYVTGYTVAAGHVRIVDLGTEFSVQRGADGRVRVDVFTGSVEATEFDASGRPVTTHLIAAAAARIFGVDASVASIEATVLDAPPIAPRPLAIGDPGISDRQRPIDTIVINPAALASYSDQDGLHDQPTRAAVSDGGRTVMLTGNAWKALPLSYDVGPDTVLEFECRIANAGELIGIGLDDDNQYSTGTLFALSGRENQLPYFDYSQWTPPTDGWRHVRLRLGDKTPAHARQLVLFADDDQSGAAEASFRNIRLYREPNTNPLNRERMNP